jgi:hypothetical protein
MKKNHWVVMKKSPTFSYEVVFSNKRMVDIQELWQYSKRILIAAEETEIMRVVETEKDEEYYFNAKESSESYIDFADRILREEGKHLLWQLRSCRGSILSKLCYYDLSGQVVEEEIPYPAIVLDKTRPEVDWLYRQSNKAIELSILPSSEIMSDHGGELLPSEFISVNGKRYSHAYLSIETHTDIWFPLVSGLGDSSYVNELDLRDVRDLGEDLIEFYGDEWFDNSELAMRHTPRFNNFIRQVKQLTSEYGGTWNIRTRASMWNEDGIVLDMSQILQRPFPDRNQVNSSPAFLSLSGNQGSLEIGKGEVLSPDVADYQRKAVVPAIEQEANSETQDKITKKNRWVVREGSGYANWEARFPSLKMLDVQELWQYLRKVLIVAEENEVVRIVEMNKFFEGGRAYCFNAEESSESFVDFFDEVLREGGNDLIWELNRVEHLSKLCYYNLSGQVVEEAISCPAIPLKKMRPKLRKADTRNQPAIGWHVYVGRESEFGYLEDDELRSCEFIADGKMYSVSTLSISIPTDIWFPLVRADHDELAKGKYHLRGEEEKVIEYAGSKWFDNSELAMRHTPRLNNFIRQAKELALEYGGTWEIMSFGTSFDNMWNEDGIVLDMDQILQYYE